ncbi:MAG: hypothetical protein FJZ04_01250 [Candidatus Moranbacteria bacterium]|nr:hypothetical protein [Candidatus Moranbacteria bacterium]
MRPDVAYENNYFATEKPLLPGEETVYNFYESNPRLRAGRDWRVQLILMDNFRDVHGRNALEEDRKKVISHYEQKKTDFNKRGELMEYLLSETENADWFGENCSICRASKFDDIKNFTDLVFEWEEADEICRLAVDCTVSGDEAKLDQKARGIMRQVYRGDLSSLKYHTSPLDEKKEALFQVPKVLLILDQSAIGDLSKIFSKIIKKESGANSAFGEFYIQLVLLREMEFQLDYQLGELMKAINEKKRKGQLDKEELRINAHKKINRVLDIIRNLIKEKESSLDLVNVQRASVLWEESPYCQYLRSLPLKLNRANWDRP